MRMHGLADDDEPDDAEPKRLAPELRIMFAIAERLHQPISVVERMSAREVQGWVDLLATRTQDDDAIDMATLSPEQLRGMFPGR